MFSIFSFGKKKQDEFDDLEPKGKKRSSMDDFEQSLKGSSILGKNDMKKLGGGKSSNKSLGDDSSLQDTFSSTIPL